MSGSDKDIPTTLTALAGGLAWFSAPVLKYAPATYLYMAGIMLAVGLAGIWISADLDDPKPKELRAAPWLFAGGFVVFAGLIAYAGWVSDMNDERCFHIQRAMLLPEPARTDLPDLFTALSCRPQGNDDIQLPKKVSTTKPMDTEIGRLPKRSNTHDAKPRS